VQIFGVQSPYTDVTPHSTQLNQSNGSFKDQFNEVGQTPVQEFMAFANETPAQWMFSNFLASKHISQAQYDSMSSQEQEALRQQFEQQMKQQMLPAANTISSAGAK
jgi:hypothetical protein